HVFQHTLALDSTYVLAYQHIVDALRGCAETPFRVCIRDSAYYGEPRDLERRFGRAAINRVRQQARDAEIATARGWVAAVPGSARPRQVLLTVLTNEQRYDEALQEAAAMDRLGWSAEAAFSKGQALFLTGRAGDAGAAVAEGLAIARDTILLFQAGLQDWIIPPALLASSGRWNATLRLNAKMFRD